MKRGIKMQMLTAGLIAVAVLSVLSAPLPARAAAPTVQTSPSSTAQQANKPSAKAMAIPRPLDDEQQGGACGPRLRRHGQAFDPGAEKGAVRAEDAKTSPAYAAGPGARHAVNPDRPGIICVKPII
jgi:hypothetical protein